MPCWGQQDPWSRQGKAQRRALHPSQHLTLGAERQHPGPRKPSSRSLWQTGPPGPGGAQEPRCGRRGPREEDPGSAKLCGVSSLGPNEGGSRRPEQSAPGSEQAPVAGGWGGGRLLGLRRCQANLLIENTLGRLHGAWLPAAGLSEHQERPDSVALLEYPCSQSTGSPCRRPQTHSFLRFPFCALTAECALSGEARATAPVTAA